MKKVTIKTGSDADFFKRGVVISRALDACKPAPSKLILTFEDPSDLIKLISGARLNLFRAIMKEPGSITALAKRLKRNRSTVKRDIDAMQAAGMIIVREKVQPGLRRIKVVCAVVEQVTLECRFT